MTSLVMQLGSRMPAPLHAGAYRAQQWGLMTQLLVGHRVMRLLARKQVETREQTLLEVQQRYRELIATDLRNVEQGYYPKSLLFQFPYREYLRALPSLARDVPRTLWRMWKRNSDDLPPDVALERYPEYYRRNFHWQTDGYLSRRSARIYDIGVEYLFLGTADVMRRQVIPPVARLARHAGDELRLLDVGCGTGRTLKQIHVAHPAMRLFGIDLSPFYLQHARELLAGVDELSLVADNAERMPFVDDYFDAVTSVHLFHELPKSARRNVIAEMWRVLRPGGVLVIQDSGQLSDGAGIAELLGRFSAEFHEPFHAGYLRDDLATALLAQGFDVEATEAHFVSKVVIAHKPQARAA